MNKGAIEQSGLENHACGGDIPGNYPMKKPVAKNLQVIVPGDLVRAGGRQVHLGWGSRFAINRHPLERLSRLDGRTWDKELAEIRIRRRVRTGCSVVIRLFNVLTLTHDDACRYARVGDEADAAWH